MSRFSDDYDGEEFNNQWALWHQAYLRALNGRRGQQALLELHQAMQALPAPRLISGHLAANGEVCAVGALVAHRRVAQGEDRGVVLRSLEALAPPLCTCWHTSTEHAGGTGHCTGHKHRGELPCGCTAFEDSGESDDYGDLTASVGVKAGLAYSLAWRLAQLNDDTLGECSPEERYEKVMRWIEDKLLPVPV